MNQPAYQDWAKYVIPSADVITSDATTPGTDYEGPLFDCSAWPYIVVFAVNGDSAITQQFQITWTPYASALDLLPGRYVILQPNAQAIFTKPVLGRQLQVGVHQLSGVTTSQATFNVLGVSHQPTKYDMAFKVGSLMDDTTTYGAGGTKTISANYWYEGPVEVALFSNNNTAAWVEFQFYDIDNAWHDFAILQALSWPNSVSHVISFPAAPVRANVNNQGAGQTIAFHVIPSAQV